MCPSLLVSVAADVQICSPQTLAELRALFKAVPPYCMFAYACSRHGIRLPLFDLTRLSTLQLCVHIPPSTMPYDPRSFAESRKKYVKASPTYPLCLAYLSVALKARSRRLLWVSKNANTGSIKISSLAIPLTSPPLSRKNGRRARNVESPCRMIVPLPWTYTSNGYMTGELPADNLWKKMKDSQEELGVLIDGFIFGEKIQDGDFKDAIIDALISSVSTIGKEDKCWYPAGEKVDRAYKGTPPGSPLRRLLVDMHVYHGHRDWVKDDASSDFLVDLVRDLLDVCDVSLRSDPTSQHVSSCPYHCHGDDLQCYNEKFLGD